MDKEKLELIVFDIVNSAGTAKGLAYEALAEAEKGNYEEADKLLKEADQLLKVYSGLVDKINIKIK